MILEHGFEIPIESICLELELGGKTDQIIIFGRKQSNYFSEQITFKRLKSGDTLYCRNISRCNSSFNITSHVV